MNRFIALIIVLAAFALPSSAQVGEPRNDFAVGINGGVVANKVGFTPKINQFFNFGPTFGLTFRYTSERYMGMYCAFQAEANYAALGWKEDIYSSANEKLEDEYRRALGYIQVPLLANLGFGQIDRGFKGYFVAGPQFGYLINDKEHRSETWTMRGLFPDRMNNVISQYDKPVENKFEYGITGGLGGEFSTAVGHFLVEGRYYMALSNLYSNAKTEPFPKSNNSTITLKVTYLIDLTH